VSVDGTVARVAQLEAMLGLSPAGAPVGTPQTTGTTPGSSDFAARLASVTAATQPSAAAGATNGTTAPTGASGTPGAATPYAPEIDAAAAKYNVDPALLRGLIRQESNFNPNAGSPAGAQGLCQLMPGTAAALGCTNVHDPAQNIDAGAKYLRQQLDAFGGDVTKALAAYNAGPGAVKRYGGVPPYAETQNYVRQVQAYADDYRRQAGSSQPVAAQAAAGSLPYSTV
jgi:soluble lytic murein transglycosylase-like protein